MITQLEVKNFRNIKDSIWYFDSNKAIFSGQNGVGKSNTLNALMWLLTGTLLTDKYGVGENDIVSIIPTDYQKGQHTEVSIWTDAGTKFTKRYKCTFQRGTDRINGHTTELLINDVLQSKISDFEEELWRAFAYVPTFKTKDVKELNLFIDPLYALQKLEADKLRKLLVAIGCSVANEEVEGYEELSAIGIKYLGDFDKAASDYKKQAQSCEKALKSLEAKLETVADIEEFDPTNLNKFNSEKSKLIEDKARLRDSNLDFKIAEIDSKIQEIKLEKRLIFEQKHSSIKAEIEKINQKIALEEEKIAMLKYSKTVEISNSISALKNDIQSNKNQIDIYNKYIKKYDQDIESLVQEAKKGRQIKSDNSIKLVSLQGSYYTNYITCPHCNESFPASEEDKIRFENDKNNRIGLCRKAIQEVQNRETEIKDSVAKLTSERDAAKNEVYALEEKNKSLSIKLNHDEHEYNRLANEPVDRTTFYELHTKLETLQIELASLEKEKFIIIPEVEELMLQKKELQSNSEEAIKLQVTAIEDALLDVEDKLSAEYVKRSKWAEKQQYQEQFISNQREFNTLESIRSKIVLFVQKRIQLLNERAYKKTGIKFVMAEANLGDGNIKEQTVCYATVDGVPFKDVNTAKKIEVGIQFINTLKQIALNDFESAVNLFPMLIDKLECFDSLDKVSSLNTTQLIATRVSDTGLKLICI